MLRPVVDQCASITILPVITYNYNEADLCCLRLHILARLALANFLIQLAVTHQSWSIVHGYMWPKRMCHWSLKIQKNPYGHPICIKLPCESDKLSCPVNNLGIFWRCDCDPTAIFLYMKTCSLSQGVSFYLSWINLCLGWALFVIFKKHTIFELVG